MISNITPAEVNQLIQSGEALLFDVREQEEVAEGMAEPAKWFPLSHMVDGAEEWEKFLGQLSKVHLLVFYCASGKRSDGVAEYLAERGFKTANMGGFSNWRDAGLKTKLPSF